MNKEACKFTEDHEWVFLDDGIATIGVSNYAIEELGEVVFVELPDLNITVSQKEEFGTIESVKTVSSLYSPISGSIDSTNNNLESQPDLVNSSPYNEGWIIRIKPSQSTELDSLMSYDEYQAYLKTL